MALPEAWDLFHLHIDGCARCAGQIFDLCHEGDRLLRVAAEVIADALERPASTAEHREGE